MLQYELTVEQRNSGNKHELKELRKNKLIPCVAYGHNEKNRLFSIKESEVYKLFHQISDESIIINIKLPEEKLMTIIKDIQRDPRTYKISHIDFQILHKGEKIKLDVPVHLTGTPKGVKEGGFLEQMLREVTIRCIPSQIPEHFELDISDMGIGSSLHVSDIKFDKGEMITPLDETIAIIIAPKVEVEEEKEEEEIEEPELIKGTKTEDNESE